MHGLMQPTAAERGRYERTFTLCVVQSVTPHSSVHSEKIQDAVELHIDLCRCKRSSIEQTSLAVKGEITRMNMNATPTPLTLGLML